MRSFVMLNLFQHPFVVRTEAGTWTLKQVQGDALLGAS
jgi:hypothetical protein